jgi:4-aminobutyrate aminotransferase-like enzyme
VTWARRPKREPPVDQLTAVRGRGGWSRIAPPLTITDAELALGLTILDQAIADIAS